MKSHSASSFLLAITVAISGSAPRAQSVESTGSTIKFSGYTFFVKTCLGCGPGPNIFAADNVRTDSIGRLHLAIAPVQGRWASSEIVLARPLGYGTYQLTFMNPVRIAPNAVFGFFTWDPTAHDVRYREFDFELSHWGNSGDPNAQFVVQPYTQSGHRDRFQLPSGRVEVAFRWSSVDLLCQVFAGKKLIHQHLFTQGVPSSGSENIRYNLWVSNGTVPSDGKPVELVLERFTFVPLTKGK